MNNYDPAKIEAKWQKEWQKTKLYKTKEDKKKEKFYVLDMFPYPSGEGLHVGHPKGYIATDIISRFHRMKGYSVLHPMGFDAFGLPAENYALKTKTNPADSVAKNVARYKKQLEIIGFDYDWSREVNTTDPKYYKWTQWIFLQLWKKGLAYESYEPINWCPSCKTGLANEDVENGKCERCGTIVEKKPMRQWVLRITDYAERLLNDLEIKSQKSKVESENKKLEVERSLVEKTLLDWPNSIKELQKNWIGKSEGALIGFDVVVSNKNTVVMPTEAGIHDSKIKVFTTRPDTLFGVTYLVLAPEHKLVNEFLKVVENKKEVEDYITKSKKETEIERTDAKKEKTGVELKGVSVVNPVNGEEVPVWIADYVLADYGTGAVMAVPAHDDRDFQFSLKYNLPIKQVIAPFFIDKDNVPQEGKTWSPRRNVQAIVKHPTENKIIQLHWKKVPWKTLVIGGAEDGESFEDAIKREVREETGYKNFKKVEKLGWQMESHFYAKHKDINRKAFTQVFTIELKDLEKDELAKEESEKHEVVWVPISDINKTFWPISELPEIVSHLENGSHAFVGDGKVINSGKFDGKDSESIKKEITEFAHGKWVTKYKLRDWVFSRQRYWGEPIPVIHCAGCAGKQLKEKAKISLNFYKKDAWNRIMRGEVTLETRALNPEEPDRYFGDVKVGDLIHATLKGEKKEAIFRVKNATKLGSLFELFSNKEMLSKGFARKCKNIVELGKAYNSLSPSYAQKINDNGMIAWEIEPMTVVVPVPEKDLPVKLPRVKSYEPTGTGESPLAAIEKWVNVKCPICKGPAKRETNTMPQWAGSSWYYLRYEDVKNNKKLVDPKIEKYWSPVDVYVGGAEHATRHLIYARFWHKFLYDIGVVSTIEPFIKLQHVGLIMGEDGRKMSKRFGNVVNPDEIVGTYGADTLRIYEMFMGPFDQEIAWNTSSMVGSRRFIERVWKLSYATSGEKSPMDTPSAPAGAAASSRPPSRPPKCPLGTSSPEVATDKIIHKVIKKVTEDIETMNFNTAISALMIATNELEKIGTISKENYEILLKLLAPFAPHATEELWITLGNKKSIHVSSWPVCDEKLIVDDEVNMVVQVNGKVRDSFKVKNNESEDAIKKIVLELPVVKKWLEGKEVVKIIVIKGKLVSVVVK